MIITKPDWEHYTKINYCTNYMICYKHIVFGLPTSFIILRLRLQSVCCGEHHCISCFFFKSFTKTELLLHYRLFPDGKGSFKVFDSDITMAAISVEYEIPHFMHILLYTLYHLEPLTMKICSDTPVNQSHQSISPTLLLHSDLILQNNVTLVWWCHIVCVLLILWPRAELWCG